MSAGVLRIRYRSQVVLRKERDDIAEWAGTARCFHGPPPIPDERADHLLIACNKFVAVDLEFMIANGTRRLASEIEIGKDGWIEGAWKCDGSFQLKNIFASDRVCHGSIHRARVSFLSVRDAIDEL